MSSAPKAEVVSFERTEDVESPGVVYVKLTIRVPGEMKSVTLTVNLGDEVKVTSPDPDPKQELRLDLDGM